MPLLSDVTLSEQPPRNARETPSAAAGRSMVRRDMGWAPRNSVEAGGVAGSLGPAGGAPDADGAAGAEQRLGEFHDDREHVESGEGIDARIPEGRGLACDDVLELHQVEEERIVAHARERGQAELARHDRLRSEEHTSELQSRFGISYA